MDERLVVNVHAERREDGIVLVLHFANEDVAEHYLSAVEARDVLDRLNEALSAHSEGETNG